MADETMHDSLRLAATNTGIAKGTIVSETGVARGASGAMPPKNSRTYSHFVL